MTTDPFTEAPCRTHLDRYGVDLWFPPERRESDQERGDRLATAKAICSTCPLIEDCQQRADEIAADGGHQWGVFAGHDIDPHSRRKHRTCGTNAGYQKHRRDGDQPCEPCMSAAREYKNQTRQRQREGNVDRQRRKRAKAGAKPQPALQPCGTPAAYQRHKKAGEQPCDPCKAAQATYNRRRSAKKRAEREALR